jgi:hypothetical protein
LFGKDGKSGRIRKEIAKEDVLSMKEAWKDKGENEIGKKEGKERRVTEGVLMSSEVRETHPLKILLEKVQVEDVESLPGLVDGDRVLIIPKGNYSRREINVTVGRDIAACRLTMCGNHTGAYSTERNRLCKRLASL